MLNTSIVGSNIQLLISFAAQLYIFYA